MNSLNNNLKGYGMPNSDIPSGNQSSEPMACMSTRSFHYGDIYTPLNPIEISQQQQQIHQHIQQQHTANISDIDSSGLSYLPPEYFSSPSFGSPLVGVTTANASSPPVTYASLMSTAQHVSEMEEQGYHQSSVSGSVSGVSYIDGLMRKGTSAPLHHFLGSLTSRLPELHTAVAANQSVTPEHQLGYLTPHSTSSLHLAGGSINIDCGMRSSPHASLVSPTYSPSSVTTQGSSGKQMRSGGGTDDKPGAFKSRCKKESHNRIERRRRDYINSQITRLSGLLPADMYRDVDGRRNKGTVLRLSVSYITELRQAVQQSSTLYRETNMARQLIPLLINHIRTLETIVKELTAAGKAPNEANGMVSVGSASYEDTLDAWRVTMETNVTRHNAIAAAAASTVSGGIQSKGGTGSSSDLRNLPLLENVQVSFAGIQAQQQQSQLSPYLPNASHMFLGGMKQEDEEAYRHHLSLQQPPQHHLSLQKQDDQDDLFQDEADTTDSFFDPNAPKFDEMMQLGNDCNDPMQQVECHNN